MPNDSQSQHEVFDTVLTSCCTMCEDLTATAAGTNDVMLSVYDGEDVYVTLAAGEPLRLPTPADRPSVRALSA